MPDEIQIDKTEVVYDNRWLKMMKTTYRRHPANGDETTSGEYLYASRRGDGVIAPSAVIVCAIHNDGVENRIVITDEFRIPLNAREVGFPAGLIEKGSSPEETAIKELFEETGLRVTKVRSDMTSGTLISSAGMSDEAVVIVFVECDGTPSKDHLEEIEDINTKLLDIDQMRDMMAQPGILIGAKAWGIMQGFLFAGKIAFPA